MSYEEPKGNIQIQSKMSSNIAQDQKNTSIIDLYSQSDDIFLKSDENSIEPPILKKLRSEQFSIQPLPMFDEDIGHKNAPPK